MEAGPVAAGRMRSSTGPNPSSPSRWRLQFPLTPGHGLHDRDFPASLVAEHPTPAIQGAFSDLAGIAEVEMR